MFLETKFWIKWLNLKNLQNQKLSIGGTAEKIISAMHSVLNEHTEEESELNKCKTAIRHVGRLEKDVEQACTHGK